MSEVLDEFYNMLPTVSQALRDQLDHYAEIIHHPIANVNLTPFELYGMKESSEDYFARQSKLLPLVRFNNAEDLTMKELDDIIISLENLAELYSTISKNNLWSYCNPKSLLPADLREIEMLINDTLFALVDGNVKFERKDKTRKQVSVYPKEA